MMCQRNRQSFCLCYRSVFAYFYAFETTNAVVGVSNYDVLVKSEQDVDFAENIFQTSIETFPTRLAQMSVQLDVGGA